jgi:hypothetical protein
VVILGLQIRKVIASYSPSHIKSSDKTLKFTLNFKLLFTSMVNYMFRPIWTLLGVWKLSAENYCTFVNEYSSQYTLVYAPMCCTSVALCDSSYVSCAAVIIKEVMLWNCILRRKCNGFQQQFSKHLMMTISVETCSTPLM